MHPCCRFPLTESAEMKKKKKAISKAETYKVYIYKVLKQVHPDTGISSKVRCSGSSVGGMPQAPGKGNAAPTLGHEALGAFIWEGESATSFRLSPGHEARAHLAQPCFRKCKITVHSLVLYPPFLLRRPWAS